MNEFKDIHDFEGWRAKLEELLAEAAVAARQDDVEARFGLTQRLTQFIRSSAPNNAPDIQHLDLMAEKTVQGLLRQTIEERLAAIGERTAEIARLSEKFDAQAEAGEKAAKSIRLERAVTVVDSLTESVRALKEFRGLLESPVNGQGDPLAGSIDRVISSIQRLRTSVEGTL